MKNHHQPTTHTQNITDPNRHPILHPQYDVKPTEVVIAVPEVDDSNPDAAVAPESVDESLTQVQWNGSTKGPKGSRDSGRRAGGYWVFKQLVCVCVRARACLSVDCGCTTHAHKMLTY